MYIQELAIWLQVAVTHSKQLQPQARILSTTLGTLRGMTLLHLLVTVVLLHIILFQEVLPHVSYLLVIGKCFEGMSFNNREFCG